MESNTLHMVKRLTCYHNCDREGVYIETEKEKKGVTFYKGLATIECFVYGIEIQVFSGLTLNRFNIIME